MAEAAAPSQAEVGAIKYATTMQPQELPPELPEALYEPLHVLEPQGWSWWHVLLGLLLLALAWWLWRRLRRRPAPRTAAASRPPDVRPVAAVTGFDAFLAELRQRHRTSSDFRVALHELAAGLREYCERSPRGKGFSFLTAREIATRLGSTALANVFELAADLRFGRNEPSFDDFEAACDLSREAVRKEGW